MVSFSCENCGDVLTKKKLDPHRNQCRGASYTCLDCMVHFPGTEYRSHTSCISEAQKYQGALYREKDKGNKKGGRKSVQAADERAMVPRGAYVEDVPEDGEQSHAVAVVDVPPRAPTPPPAVGGVIEGADATEGVNVFDFLVGEATPTAAQPRIEVREPKFLGNTQDSQYSQYSNGNGSRYQQHGYSYGDAPVEPSFERYDSWHSLAVNPDSQSQSQSQSQVMPGSFVQTPASKGEKRSRKDKEGKSDKKRKRQHVDELDLSAAKRPSSRGGGGDEQMLDAPGTVSRTLHSGLTGGLSKLVTDPGFYEDRIDAGPTPISPLKRSKREHKDRDGAKEDRRKSSSYTSHSTTSRAVSSSTRADDTRRDRDREPRRAHHDDKHRRRPSPSSSPEPRTTTSHAKALPPPPRPSSVQPTSTNAIAHRHNTKAELFLSFVNKGPESEKGVSVNKALKRYHREVGERSGADKEEGDKELWKGLRVRRNERGEFVLFLGDE